MINVANIFFQYVIGHLTLWYFANNNFEKKNIERVSECSKYCVHTNVNEQCTL